MFYAHMKTHYEPRFWWRWSVLRWRSAQLLKKWRAEGFEIYIKARDKALKPIKIESQKRLPSHLEDRVSRGVAYLTMSYRRVLTASYTQFIPTSRIKDRAIQEVISGN